jgi:ubiquinone/menaquinone biosynthesis C-methylase UbiE
MASNAKNIINRYGDGTREEKRSSGDRADYIMEYKYTKVILDKYITVQSTVLEVGCGTGYYGVYLSGNCKKYCGVDITPGNINLFKEKIQNLHLSNVEAIIGDATDLRAFSDESYDVVLSFGPIYHLPPEERELVFLESKRICKNNGIIMFAYINKIGAYLAGCLQEADKYPNKQKNKTILLDGIDDSRDNIYWFTMPEEMEGLAEKYNLVVIDNLGVDFVLIPEMYSQTSEKKDAWEELINFISASKSCTGFANHAVMVCKKNEKMELQEQKNCV